MKKKNVKQSVSSCHIKKDDTVKVVTGKDKGRIGKVLRVIKKKERIVVEKVNMMKRHTKSTTQNKQGGIIETEAPIHWSNVRVMCNKCVQPVRVGSRYLEDGKKVRVCVKCKEIMD